MTRLMLRLHRLELSIIGSALVLIAATGFAMAAIADGAGLARCLSDPTALGCADGLSTAAWLSNARPFFSGALTIVSVIGGTVMGIGLIAQEIEYGTAALAWTLFPSRRKWLASRVAFALGFLVVFVGVGALAADVFERARHIPPIVGDSLLDYQVRGLPVVARSVLAFAVALLIGAIAGRTLPGLLVALPALAAIVLVIEFGLSAWQMGELQPISDPGAQYVQEGYRDRDGRILLSSEAFSILPGDDPDFRERFTPISLGWPGSLSGEFVAQESLAYLLAAGALLALTVKVVDRRRPSQT